MGRQKGQATTLYTVWRNKDDMLLILDGTAEECCRLLGMNKNSFYRLVCSTGNKGYGNMYTIRKANRDQIKREEES